MFSPGWLTSFGDALARRGFATVTSVIGSRTLRKRFEARDSMGAMAITSTSIAHVRLAVTDIDRSRRFYDSVFGWPVAIEVPDDADAATQAQLGILYGGVIFNIGGALLIGLRPVAADTFDEDRVGLDHIAFNVASKEELDSAAAHLDDLGIGHEPIKDIGASYILEFRDPDNIAIELSAPK